MRPALAPSILAADLGRLAEILAELERLGADRVHIDVMDGRFVPNLTLGMVVVEAIRRHTKLHLDVHLMIVEPERYARAFVEAGADAVAFHLEATPHPHRLLGAIRETGARAGLAFNPGTPVAALKDLVNAADQLLLMSVNPGFAGQRFIERSYARLGELDALRQAENPAAEIVVDGGVKPENAARLAGLGADVLVAASSLFNDRPLAENFEAFRRALAAQD